MGYRQQLAKQVKKKLAREERARNEQARSLLREQDRQRKKKAYQREGHLIKVYGINQFQYDRMQKSQNGRCCICGEKYGNRRLHVDHCHESGEVRGLLCKKCNVGLGWFRDNPEFLRKAAEYIENPPGVPSRKRTSSSRRSRKYRKGKYVG